MASENDAQQKPANAVYLARGHVFDDFTPGRMFVHDQRRTVLESDNALFTTLTMHYNPVYLDREYAREQGLRDIQVNPLLVFNTVFGISVEDLSEGGGPFLGITEMIYGEPVYAGDTLRAQSIVISARLSEKREKYGIVKWATEGFNQHGAKVIAFQRSNLVRRSR